MSDSANPDDLAALTADPELERLRARTASHRDERGIRSPWTDLRLGWTAMGLGLVGEVVGVSAARALAGAEGAPEVLMRAAVGFDLSALPPWMLEPLRGGGLGVALFGAFSSGLLLYRVSVRHLETRHAALTRRGFRSWVAAAVLMLVAASIWGG